MICAARTCGVNSKVIKLLASEITWLKEKQIKDPNDASSGSLKHTDFEDTLVIDERTVDEHGNVTGMADKDSRRH